MLKYELEDFKALVQKVLIVPDNFHPTGQYQQGQVDALRQAYFQIFGENYEKK